MWRLAIGWLVHLLILIIALLAPWAGAAVRFNFVPQSGTALSAIEGFHDAGSLWSSALRDNVTINIRVGFAPLGPQVLSHTESAWTSQRYADVRSHLLADVTSADDARSARSLPKGSFNLLLNYVANHPADTALAQPFLDKDRDQNNSTIRLHTANAKALGLAKPNAKGIDATIVFSSDWNWDFDPTDGITPGAYDFVGIAAHEIGHTLGFVSGVDTLEATASRPLRDDQLVAVTPLDLFRFSADSAKAKAIDFTADGRQKFLSLDGGKTSLALLAAGTLYGGQQASHWSATTETGLFRPIFSAGEGLGISRMDAVALDVVGWNLSGTAAGRTVSGHLAAGALPDVALNALAFPEPSLMGPALLAAGSWVLRRRGRKGSC